MSKQVSKAIILCCIFCLPFTSTEALAQSHPDCSAIEIAVDKARDNDGYGWENNKTCVYDKNATTTTSTNTSGHPDCSATEISVDKARDNDGYGWENNKTCVYDKNATTTNTTNTSGHPDCSAGAIEEDRARTVGGNDGYGWENNKTCVYDVNVTTASCEKPNLTGSNNPQVSDDINADRWNISAGTCEADPANTSDRDDAGKLVDVDGQRGLRTYCHVSHYSYDDPIVQPTGAGNSHLHVFWGNTGTNQNSVVADANASSTCDGGIRNLSAYWMPALFDENLNVVLPKQVLTYYKTVGAVAPNTNSELPFPNDFVINDIPDDLQILAKPNVKGYGFGKFKVADCDIHKVGFADCVQKSSSNELSFKIQMPNCLATDGAGNPILKDPNGAPFNSHLAYAQTVSGLADYRADNYCPTSHPFRIPQVELVAYYDIAAQSGWKLASDIMNNKSKGTTLHADYIAKWERDTADSAMSFMVDCNMAKADCEHGEDSNLVVDRYTTVLGPIYNTGAQVLGGSKRPFINFQPTAFK